MWMVQDVGRWFYPMFSLVLLVIAFKTYWCISLLKTSLKNCSDASPASPSSFGSFGSCAPVWRLAPNTSDREEEQEPDVAASPFHGGVSNCPHGSTEGGQNHWCLYWSHWHCVVCCAGDVLLHPLWCNGTSAHLDSRFWLLVLTTGMVLPGSRTR